jgi:nicotinamidase-related amidase
MSNYLELLTPQNSQLLFIDQQPQMAFGVQSIDRQTLKNNVVALAKAAKLFKVPTTITTVETESFSGHTYPELLAVFPQHKILERTSMNSWDERNVRDALAAIGRKKVVVSGLWTEVCNLMFALDAMRPIRDLHGRRRVRRHVGGCPQICHGSHGAGGRRAGDLATGSARMAARLGA